MVDPEADKLASIYRDFWSIATGDLRAQAPNNVDNIFAGLRLLEERMAPCDHYRDVPAISHPLHSPPALGERGIRYGYSKFYFERLRICD